MQSRNDTIKTRPEITKTVCILRDSFAILLLSQHRSIWSFRLLFLRQCCCFFSAFLLPFAAESTSVWSIAVFFLFCSFTRLVSVSLGEHQSMPWRWDSPFLGNISSLLVAAFFLPLHFFFRSFPIHLAVCVCTFVWQKQFRPNWINNSFIIKAMSCVRVWSLTVDKQTIFIYFLLSCTFIIVRSSRIRLGKTTTTKKPFALVMWLKRRDFVQRFLHAMCHPCAQDNTHKSQSN